MGDYGLSQGVSKGRTNSSVRLGRRNMLCGRDESSRTGCYGLVCCPLTVYGGGSPSPIMSLSLSKLSWLVAIDGSELALTNCGKLPSDNDADGPGLSSKSDSGLDAYDKRDVVMGNRKSSERDSTGWGSVIFGYSLH